MLPQRWPGLKYGSGDLGNDLDKQSLFQRFPSVFLLFFCVFQPLQQSHQLTAVISVPFQKICILFSAKRESAGKIPAPQTFRADPEDVPRIGLLPADHWLMDGIGWDQEDISLFQQVIPAFDQVPDIAGKKQDQFMKFMIMIWNIPAPGVLQVKQPEWCFQIPSFIRIADHSRKTLPACFAMFSLILA